MRHSTNCALMDSWLIPSREAGRRPYRRAGGHAESLIAAAVRGRIRPAGVGTQLRLRARGSSGAKHQRLNRATRERHCGAIVVRNGKLPCALAIRTSRNADQRYPLIVLSVYKSVAALSCILLHCAAFDCDGEGAWTP